MVLDNLWLCLFFFDGGGVWGFLILYILWDFMKRIVGLDKLVLKLCECFDMIGGISMGGLIVIMFGWFWMFVEDCIVVYIMFFIDVFLVFRRLYIF